MRRTVVVAALGAAQTLAWGSSYYLPAILADPIETGLDLSRTVVFGVFSGSLLVSAFLGPAVGRAIDQHGGRGVLAISNLILAAGLVLLGTSQGIITLTIAWAFLGVGMATGLYDPAFATLTGLYGRAARGPITGITLIAGFASTVGWPLSAFLDGHFGWRGACLIWAGLHILVGLPLNHLLIPKAPPPEKLAEAEGEAPPASRGAMPLLAFVFAATWFVTGATAAHLLTFSKSSAQVRRRRLPPQPSSVPHRSAHGWWSSALCARCIRSYQRGLPQFCIRSVWLCCSRQDQRRQPPSRSFTGQETGC